MEFLITLIGNAAVDHFFRERLLSNPVDTVDEYGFRLTKSDFEMMKAVFGHSGTKDELRAAFVSLEDALYKALEAGTQEITRTQKTEIALPPKGCGRPCFWSIFPPGEPHELRQERERQEKTSRPGKGRKAA